MDKNIKIDRRRFLQVLGAGSAGVVLSRCGVKKNENGDAPGIASGKPSSGTMTYRTNPSTGDKVSILGYGCMRLPTKNENGEDVIDQDAVNRQVDYALAHGVNYFDTSPAYCKGKSEQAMGIALSRHPRDSYYIATKLSNFSPDT